MPHTQGLDEYAGEGDAILPNYLQSHKDMPSFPLVWEAPSVRSLVGASIVRSKHLRKR